MVAGTGQATLTGGLGDDVFNLSLGTTGSITGNGGNDKVYVNGNGADISQFTINGVSTLATEGGAGPIRLTSAQFSAFSTIESDTNVAAFEAADGGNYNLTTKTGVPSTIAIDGSSLTSSISFSANGGDVTFTGGQGNDIFALTGGGSGEITGGNGTDQIRILPVGGLFDLTQFNVRGVETLQSFIPLFVQSSIKLNNAQFNSFTSLTRSIGTSKMSLQLANGGTYNLTTKTSSSGVGALDASQITAAVTLVGNGITMMGGTGNDTLQGRGTTVYKFDTNFGQDTVTNNGSSGKIDFGTNITEQNLWFSQSGNDLLMQMIGTDDQVTVDDWFASSSAQVSRIDAGDFYINSQLSQLISAMATFSSNNPGFAASQAIAMPTDTTLQTTIAASWASA